jgi:integrase
MPKHMLTDRKIRNVKPGEKQRLADGQNLYLSTPASGVFSWQLRYRLGGKPQTYTIGKWPTISLAEAREVADAARKRVAQGEHLTESKREAKQKRLSERANTFDKIAADWVKREARLQQWTSDYRAEVEASIRNHLAALHRRAIGDIRGAELAAILRAVEERAPQMLEKVRRRLNAILDYAVEQAIIVGNPLPAIRRRRQRERRHYPAVTALRSVGQILRDARASDPCKGVLRAHLLLAFTAMRISEIVEARWDEFNLDGVHIHSRNGIEEKFSTHAGNWVIPRARMKQHRALERGPHVVPLPPELLSTLREWRKADGNAALYVCPAPGDACKPVTAEAVEKHYRRTLRLGGKHSPHSWRATFSTVCREAGKDADTVEAQLDHVVGNKVAAAYDRAKRLELRRELMTWYEGALISARDGATVVSIGREARA